MYNNTLRRQLSRSLFLVLCVAPFATAGTITLRSGNGSGATDTEVHMLVGPADSPFGAAFTSGDFAAAQGGDNAFRITNHSLWISALPGDSLASWIGTSPSAASSGNSALYAISFVIDNTFSSATSQLNYAVDNLLGNHPGTGPNAGVFFNGIAISGDSYGGNFDGEYTLSRSDIGSLLHVGSNTLYLNVSDYGGPAGFLFRATITTDDVVAPEPGTFGLGILSMVATYALAGKFARKL